MQRNNELNRRSFSNFGFSTIMIVFVMICIVTFSALALVTANSDYKLSSKAADLTSRYYSAEKEATVRLQQVDTILSGAYAQSSNRATYYILARKKLKASDLQIHLTDATSSTLTISYTVDIGSSQALYAELKAVYPPESGGVFYELSCWETVTSLPEDTEDTPNVIGNK